ncbi:MAG: proteobacterial dedicated sortase system histidine kinase [Gammaproteobacteria bacterium]|nr:proteobacterial dedicated sortase system histidine kinase [Gammaproteobacteria bacterium]MDH5802322.1 proteobacterial dedicated sortase system histidine kinase [Gammaproteobacteria bacterium]
MGNVWRLFKELLESTINRVYISIRVKLVLVSLSLLAIPFIGYQYVQEMERYLRTDLETALLENARIIGTVLEDYPNIFEHSKPAISNETPASADEADTNVSAVAPAGRNHLFIRSLRSPILLDGYAEDWISYNDRVQRYQDSSGNNDPLSYRFSVGTYQRYLYALLQVKDSHVIYRKANSSAIDANDHIQIALLDQKGRPKRYILSSYTQGNMSVHRVVQHRRDTNLFLESRIGAYWLKTRSGYNVEIRIPLSMLGDRLSFGVADVDDPHSREIISLVGTNHQSTLEQISTISIASAEVENLLSRIKRSNTRIWVVDGDSNILALSGHLTDDDAADSMEEFDEISVGDAVLGIVRLFYRLILRQPAREFQDDLSAVSHLDSREVGFALNGKSTTQWRLTPDERVNILMATAPVSIKGKIVGAVAIEETSNSILLLQNRAIEILTNLSIVTLFVAIVILLGFATRLSIRIRQLRDQTENAIGEDGRILGKLKATKAADELGDLGRSFYDMLNRLAQYNRYLETMAGKLSHEFRTPITVVKSSLDNLELGNLDKQSLAYTERAREGIERLNNILTRMSEATRLEQTLQSEDCSHFDLEKVVSGCVKGYSLAKPSQQYKFRLDKINDKPLQIYGSPDLIAQLLDKLVSNATSFALPDSTIEIALQQYEQGIELSVTNAGPSLPEEMQHTLFESMVSIRDKKGDEPHLGLGLYIVRLIAEFHNAGLQAQNLSDGTGVCFSVLFTPSAS